MMKLIAFRIRNFRSIVDTGWQNLSPDSITCLIGQNESGKTSILEGLKVFYTGVISEDVLRSDLTLPEVSCRFSIPEGWLTGVTDNPGTELKELLSGLDHVELTRAWIADLSSVLMVSGEINDYLKSLEDAWQIYLSDVILKLEEEMNNVSQKEEILTGIIREESEIKSILPGNDGILNVLKFFRKKEDGLSKEDEQENSDLKSRLIELRRKKESLIKEIKSKNEVVLAGEQWINFRQKKEDLEKHLNELSVRLEDRHQKMTLLMRPLDDNSDPEWKAVLNDYRKTKNEIETALSNLDRHIAKTGYIIEGSSDQEADMKVNEVIQSYKSHYNSEILGKKYFEYSPVFELFEDFGSLLPNRIDMADIISGNDQVEGYKAARNFLSLARLDYTFFQQPSNRILKQKIENLNQSLTRNFHDFWQQSVGSNNKIHIQFELDHYNSSFGNKAGQPYLEFWIKDEGERLYPKQRSRGVRWFLSFYMELKASANINQRHLVLLVDEPGVSLHARAQEDVLKVFEDIKDKVQVIYTTHSPHLVEISKLHRILAIQRDDLDSVKSTTRVLDPLSLSAASPDTLTPLQSILGKPMSGEGFSAGRINLIVNDTGSYYMLSAVIALMDCKEKISVIPSTNVSSIPLLCNIMMGWCMDFAVLLFENDDEIKAAELLKSTVFKTEDAGKDFIIRMPGTFLNSEDLLSTLDFKKFILDSREGITISNSFYLKEKDLPRNFLLSRFLTAVKEGKIKASDLDEETIENFNMVTGLIKG